MNKKQAKVISSLSNVDTWIKHTKKIKAKKAAKKGKSK